MTGILLILLAILTIYIVFLIFQTLGGFLIRAKTEEIGLFYGPTLFDFNIAGVKIKLNLLPLGSYVKYVEDFQNLPAVKKITVVLVGLASYAFVAILGLGFEDAAHQFLKGFVQIFQCIFSPVAVGSRLIAALALVLQEQSFFTGTAILASKFLAMNLLPFGSYSGGLLIIYLLELFGFKSEKFSERFQLIGLLPMLVCMVPWIIAIVVFARNSFGI